MNTDLDPVADPHLGGLDVHLDPQPIPVDLRRDRAGATLRGLLDRAAGLRGALFGSVDGRPIASVLPHHDEGSTAAIVAASLGLGSRLADLAGEGALREIVVRSASGYVVLYAVGEAGVLTVLTTAAANLALLHLEARQVCDDLLVTLSA